MTFTQAVTRVCNRLNKNSSDTVVTTRIKGHLNDGMQERWNGYDWSFRHREYPMVLTADVTSGTLTANNGSRTVTASGTPFSTTTHVGAWLRFRQDTYVAWYRILSVTSTSVVVVEPAYQGTSGASKTYELKKTDYLLPTEINDLDQFEVSFLGHPISLTHFSGEGWRNAPQVDSTGAPSNGAVFTNEIKTSVYSIGTVTSTSGSQTLTGVGTSWLGTVTPGDSIVIGSSDTNVYSVYSVDSDTSITMYQKATVASSGVTYTITSQFGRIIRITPTADQPYTCYPRGLRAYQPLINDSDTNMFLYRFSTAVIEDAVWRELGSSPDPREDSNFQKAEMFWERARGEDDKLSPRKNFRPIHTGRKRSR